MTTFEIKKLFLSAAHFAVVGASKDQSKYGTKVLRWYQNRELDVTPVHLREKELEGLQAISSITDLPNPKETSISIHNTTKGKLVKVTLSILQEAKRLSVLAIWIQPGAEDEDVVGYIKENGLSDRVIYGGPCLLVEGDTIIRNRL